MPALTSWLSDRLADLLASAVVEAPVVVGWLRTPKSTLAWRLKCGHAVPQTPTARAVAHRLRYTLLMSHAPRSHHRPRSSGCIARSQALERDRIARLSVEERILMALGLRDRLAGLRPSPRAEQVHDESGHAARGR